MCVWEGRYMDAAVRTHTHTRTTQGSRKDLAMLHLLYLVGTMACSNATHSWSAPLRFCLFGGFFLRPPWKMEATERLALDNQLWRGVENTIHISTLLNKATTGAGNDSGCFNLQTVSTTLPQARWKDLLKCDGAASRFEQPAHYISSDRFFFLKCSKNQMSF